MDLTAVLKEIGRGKTGARDLSREDARVLFDAMLTGAVPDLELGAILVAMRIKTEGPEELLGFFDALKLQVRPLQAPTGAVRPLVIPTYSGSRRHANLTPLLAVLLEHLQVPVVLHGPAQTFGRVGTFAIFEELGIQPASSLNEANARLAAGKLVMVSLDLLSPELARLLAMRSRLGLRNSAHTLVKLIDPFAAGIRMISVSHPEYVTKMQDFLMKSGGSALLMRGTEGEPYANPRRCPQIEFYREGAGKVLVSGQEGSLAEMPDVPADNTPAVTIRWIDAILKRHTPLPLSLAWQLSAMLVASGAALDMTAAMEKVRTVVEVT